MKITMQYSRKVLLVLDELIDQTHLVPEGGRLEFYLGSIDGMSSEEVHRILYGLSRKFPIFFPIAIPPLESLTSLSILFNEGIKFFSPSLSSLNAIRNILRNDFQKEGHMGKKTGIEKTRNDRAINRLCYDSESGAGNNDEKKFKLTDGGYEYKLFNECYKNRGKKIARKDVENILDIARDTEVPDVQQILSNSKAGKTRKQTAKETTSTAKINEVVKKIRKKTGLSHHEFVLNRGNVTLR